METRECGLRGQGWGSEMKRLHILRICFSKYKWSREKKNTSEGKKISWWTLFCFLMYNILMWFCGCRLPCFFLQRQRPSSFSLTRFSPVFNWSPFSFIEFVMSKLALKLIIIIFPFLGIKAKDPHSIPPESVLYPFNHLCHVSELTPVSPHLHVTSVSSWCS